MVRLLHSVQVANGCNLLLNQQAHLVWCSCVQYITSVLDGHVLEVDVDALDPIASLDAAALPGRPMRADRPDKDPIPLVAANIKPEPNDVMTGQINCN